MFNDITSFFKLYYLTHKKLLHKMNNFIYKNNIEYKKPLYPKPKPLPYPTLNLNPYHTLNIL